MKHVSVNVLSAPDTGSQNGLQIDSSELISSSFHAYFGDTTAAGSLKVQVSNDICNFSNYPANFTVSQWVDLPSSSIAVVAGAPVIITVPQMSYRWIRAVYTSTTPGTTTVNVNMFAVSI